MRTHWIDAVLDLRWPNTPEYLATLRAMTPEEKWQCAAALTAIRKLVMTADVRSRHPDAPEEEIRMRVASYDIPADLMRKALGWDPDEKGY